MSSRCLAILLAASALAVAASPAPVVLVIGDSLSAGYNMRAEQGWVALLAARINARGLPQQVVNASISGDTTQSGVARLPRALQRHRPAVVVIELGANDGLRGIPLETTRANLTRMVGLARAAGAQVMLLGIQLPTNYGSEWNGKFHAIYTELARTYVSALGQGPSEAGLPRITELFRKMDANKITNTWTTAPYYSRLHLNLVEDVILAVVSDEFALGPAGRKWLDDDEYLVRKRVHADMSRERQRAGL